MPHKDPIKHQTYEATIHREKNKVWCKANRQWNPQTHRMERKPETFWNEDWQFIGKVSPSLIDVLLKM